MNHYEALGVGREAPLSEIRQAYLRSVLRPSDAADPASEERRRAAADAWAVLRSPELRAEYDAVLGPSPKPEPLVQPDPLPEPLVQPDPLPEWAGPPPLPTDTPRVPAEREPARVFADSTLPPMRPDLPNDTGSRVVSLMPPAIVAISIVLILLALILGSGGLLLTALLVLVVGMVSFAIIPLFDIVRGR